MGLLTGMTAAWLGLALPEHVRGNEAPIPETPPAAACANARDERHEAVKVIDGQTLVVSDGREVRLAGVLAPEPPAAVAPEAWLPGQDAAQALAELVAGKTIELSFGKHRTDRYGRLMAEVFVIGGAEPLWVQRALVAKGHARAHMPFDPNPCSAGRFRELLTAEDAARRSGAGLWSHAAYRTLPASKPIEIMQARASFALVEGTVLSTAERGGRVYLDFGSDWRSDFTVVVPPRLVGRTPEDIAKVLALKGALVRVRGWVERRNGPSIEVRDLAEVERLD